MERKDISLWEVVGRKNEFYQVKNRKTNAVRPCAVNYIKGEAINPVTGRLVERDEEGYIRSGEFLEGSEYVSRNGKVFFKHSSDKGHSSDGLSNVGGKILKNLPTYTTDKIRRIEGVLRYPPADQDSMAAALSEASGEMIITHPECGEHEYKPQPLTHAQRTELFIAQCAMAHRGGTISSGMGDDGTPTGIQDALDKFGGSTDKLEAALRNEFELRTNRLVDTEYIFRKIGGKTVLDIVVSKSNGPVIFDHKYMYVRSGNTTRCLRDQQIIDYILEYYK